MGENKRVKQRNQELYAKYLQICRYSSVSHYEAIRLAVNSPCSRYWVSPDYLYRELLHRLNPSSKNIRSSKPSPKRSRLYDRMFADFLELRKSTLFKGASCYFLSTFLVNRPAPSFYLSYERAYKIINHIKKQKRLKHV